MVLIMKKKKEMLKYKKVNNYLYVYEKYMKILLLFFFFICNYNNKNNKINAIYEMKLINTIYKYVRTN